MPIKILSKPREEDRDDAIRLIRGRHGSHCGGSGSDSVLIVLGSTEHQLLVDKSQTLSLHLSGLKSGRERRLRHLKVLNVESSPIEQGNLARLLVGRRQDVLEFAVAFTQFIATPLFRLDALTANFFAAFSDDFSFPIAFSNGSVVDILVIITQVVRLCVTAFDDPLLGTTTSGGSGGTGRMTERLAVNKWWRRRATAAAGAAAALSRVKTTIARQVRAAQVGSRKISQGRGDGLDRSVRSAGGRRDGNIIRLIRIVRQRIAQIQVAEIETRRVLGDGETVCVLQEGVRLEVVGKVWACGVHEDSGH
jgi:hypothetical protein